MGLRRFELRNDDCANSLFPQGQPHSFLYSTTSSLLCQLPLCSLDYNCSIWTFILVVKFFRSLKQGGVDIGIRIHTLT